ncbi:hypothetical protein [Actinoplanes sp. M2I2]|uniref:hypothetical protein n=1 Tax=Actinoplanes sp. M2I2 TaxID=1734444 RepID=UPI00201FF673|nr:hypothetical protein [Actinoplanes sp. M2I2]
MLSPATAAAPAEGEAVPPHRLAALPLALLAATCLTACEIDIAPGSIPPPISIAPTPSGSAGVPKYVCSQVYKVLTEGALRLAEQGASSGDEAKAEMKKTFSDMATEVEEEVSRATDPGLQAALREISDDLASGGRAADPQAYIDGGFQSVGQKLDGHCG